MHASDRQAGADADGPLDAAWRDHRGRLINIAYRMLGSLRDAEDVVSEAYTRLVGHGHEGIADLGGWLVTVTTRLCLDRLRSFEVRRREYPGPWLPEPIVELAGGAPADPADRVTLDESVRVALLVVLEQLSPAERTAFVLHDVFAIPFEDIAALVGRTPEACRQLASRARRRIDADPATRFRAGPAEHRQVVKHFALACQSGDIDALVAVLDPDVTGDFDSGGSLPGAPLGPLHGAVPIARLLAQVFTGTPSRFEIAAVNGEPGIAVLIADRVVAVISIAVRNGKVALIHAVGNPDKLPSRPVGDPPVPSTPTTRRR